MCDETASSRIASPPILPIKDVKLEAGSPCDIAPLGAVPAAVTPVGSRIPASPVAPSDGFGTEAWVRPSDLRIIAFRADCHMFAADTAEPMTPGFHPSVFRPPRA